MKIKGFEINIKKDANTLLKVNKNGEPLLVVSKRENVKPIIKNKRIVALISGAMASMLLTSCFAGSLSKDRVENMEVNLYPVYSTENETSNQEPIENLETSESFELNFEIMHYGDKTFLTLKEEDLLTMIRQALKEVYLEYEENGATPVFSQKDSVYSHFDEYNILGLMYTESSFRLLEIVDKSKGIYNIDNYSRFYGTDKNGIIYYGPGMMSEETVKYILETDRFQVNKFKDYKYFNCDGKKVEISYKNLNPYDYVVNSGAKTQAEIEQALKECIILNTKVIVTYLNRIVKDNVKFGTHTDNLNALLEYNEFNKMNTTQAQIFFALLAYNQGPNVTIKSVLNNTLFSKYTFDGETFKRGDYINNIKYPVKVMKYAKEYKLNENSTENELTR